MKKFIQKEVVDKHGNVTTEIIVNKDYIAFKSDLNKMPKEYVSVFTSLDELVLQFDPKACIAVFNYYKCHLVLGTNEIDVNKDKMLGFLGYKEAQYNAARARLSKCGYIIKKEGKWYINPLIAFKGTAEQKVNRYKELGEPEVHLGASAFRKECLVNFNNMSDEEIDNFLNN